MAKTDDLSIARIDQCKVDVQSAATCSLTTVTTLEKFLCIKNESSQGKENVGPRTQVAARKRAGIKNNTPNEEKCTQSEAALAPKERYILATEVANATLKALSDALKNPSLGSKSPPVQITKSPPNVDQRKSNKLRAGQLRIASAAQKPLKERPASQSSHCPQRPSIRRRSTSFSSTLTLSPDPGLVAIAECARIAFGYLGTIEAANTLGKDAQGLQYENGVLALIGKLIALGLDSAAAKELRVFKKRLDKHLPTSRTSKEQTSTSGEKHSEFPSSTEKLSLASLLDFGTIDLKSAIVPLVVQFLIYVLRIIAKSRRPAATEATWEYLKLSNPCSAFNLTWQLAQLSDGRIKGARQLESLAQTIFALCPSISSADDLNKLQPSAATVLSLQQLAFTIRVKWWSLVKHECHVEKELWDPFGKCLIAFHRRSRLDTDENYKLAESLYVDLHKQACDFHIVPKDSACPTSLRKILSSLAQAAGSTTEAVRWLETSRSPVDTERAGAKQAAEQVRIAAITLDATLKDDQNVDPEQSINCALKALQGSMSGSLSDLNFLFSEVNALRRVATRLLLTCLSRNAQHKWNTAYEQHSVSVIASATRFSARYTGTDLAADADVKAQHRRNERITAAWAFSKSIIDSALAVCKRPVMAEDQWKELDTLLQDCLLLLRRFEIDHEPASNPTSPEHDFICSSLVKLSNAYWAKHMQMRQAALRIKSVIAAMQRSIDIISQRTESDREAGYFSTKLEQLGETLDGQDQGELSCVAFSQCIQSHLDQAKADCLSKLLNQASLPVVFEANGEFSVLSRVLKAYHRSFLKYGLHHPNQMAFYDDTNLQDAVRGGLLELQLAIYLRTLSRSRQWNFKPNSSIATLVERLNEIYSPTKYPVRRLRSSLLVQQLSQNHLHILPTSILSLWDSSSTPETQSFFNDTGLRQFVPHLRALHDLKSSMQGPDWSIPMFRSSFSIWQGLITSVSSWDVLTKHINNVEEWLSDIEASVEFLNAKGEEYLALSVLHFLAKVMALRKGSEESDYTIILCKLGLQFLRLGYTGKAGLIFAKAESLLEQETLSIDARLKWRVSYAEYLITIGDNVKCATIMAEARSIAVANKEFMGLTKSCVTLSGRVRFNRMLADASYVYSLHATAIGSYKDAARHARQCVMLNRRTWAAFESRSNAQKATSKDEGDSSLDDSNQPQFDPLSSMRSDKGAPLVMSVTHDTLCGPEFWSLVPALYRALMQHSQIFTHQGHFQEAINVAEQAEKIARAIKSPTFLIDNASWRADCWAQSGRVDKAEAILNLPKDMLSRKSLSVVGYYSALARVYHCNDNFEEELATYSHLDRFIQDLSSASFIQSLESLSSPIDLLVEGISNINIAAPMATRKANSPSRDRNPAVKSATRTTSKSISTNKAKAALITKNQVEQPCGPDVGGRTTDASTSSIAVQCSVLNMLRISFLSRGALASILQDDLTRAFTFLEQAETLQADSSLEISHVWATFKARFAKSMSQVADNFSVNTLPESTIAFPAIGLNERVSSVDASSKRLPAGSSALAKVGRAKKQANTDFVGTMRDARDLLLKAHAQTAINGTNHLFQQISAALGHVTVLLSAVSSIDTLDSLHPLCAAYMSEIPRCNALRLTQGSVEADKELMSRDECLQWPSHVEPTWKLSSVTAFQQEYIDTIPDTWSAVSLELNEDLNELYVTRYDHEQTPFLLRLPLARHASREGDEQEFSFEDGKKDFDEIIELSDFSTKSAKDMTSREARQQWWAEREALDARLHEFLLNIQNIWLGGFRGIFSQHERQTALLSRFQKTFEKILSQHLPSRRKKTQQQRPVLDIRVLELFIGLGDAADVDNDLDEALMDLIYFVVDILQFKGEHNAYDEIDFDSMVVETYDALRAYHNTSLARTATPRHTVFILDKNLHAFPWESLPCLEQQSISRLPSLAALKERLQTARSSRKCSNAPQGHYISLESGGTSILNPSGDLTHTLKMIKPRLDELHGSWNHITNRAPSEKEFEESLRGKELMLYFGHGSGAQFIKSKTVRRIYSSHHEKGNAQPPCATTLLFGCSSGHLTENGIYEPSGMLSSYLTAGAPAVVGMLWDVTDKDCDRFALRTGELWGLWPEAQGTAPKTPAKTPRRKAKGKTRVTQLVDEVEGPRNAGPGKQPRRGKESSGEDMPLGEDRAKGVSLDEAVREARKACVLRYLNGAAAVVYGIPVYLE